jgi:hypothetical protein
VLPVSCFCWNSVILRFFWPYFMLQLNLRRLFLVKNDCKSKPSSDYVPDRLGGQTSGGWFLFNVKNTLSFNVLRHLKNNFYLASSKTNLTTKKLTITNFLIKNWRPTRLSHKHWTFTVPCSRIFIVQLCLVFWQKEQIMWSWEIDYFG